VARSVSATVALASRPDIAIGLTAVSVGYLLPRIRIRASG
jgi:hypothetical protein